MEQNLYPNSQAQPTSDQQQGDQNQTNQEPTYFSQNPTPPPPMPINTEANKPSKSNPLVVLLSLLLLVACIIAGFFAWQTQQLVKQVNVANQNLATTPTPLAQQPSPSSTPSSGETKEYISVKGGYSFNYPDNWTISTTNSDVRDVSLKLDDKDLFVTVTDNVPSIEQWYADNKAGTIETTKTSDTGYEFKVANGGNLLQSREYALLTSQNKLIRFVLEPVTDKQEADLFFSLLLDSFKLTTVTPTPTPQL